MLFHRRIQTDERIFSDSRPAADRCHRADNHILLQMRIMPDDHVEPQKTIFLQDGVSGYDGLCIDDAARHHLCRRRDYGRRVDECRQLVAFPLYAA